MKFGVKFFNGESGVLTEREDRHSVAARIAKSHQTFNVLSCFMQKRKRNGAINRCTGVCERPELTTSPSTRLRTLSPISGDMSLPNCCSVVRKRFSLQSCLAPHAGGSCWLESEAVEDMAGPLLKPLGVDGAPFSDVGEWLLPFSTAR